MVSEKLIQQRGKPRHENSLFGRRSRSRAGRNQKRSNYQIAKDHFGWATFPSISRAPKSSSRIAVVNTLPSPREFEGLRTASRRKARGSSCQYADSAGCVHSPTIPLATR
ncbi:MAG: hypothetical protein EBY36_11410, partial [Gammaproteobacteria bacterium]|nr:hypothetical protein [Gammaproteobacteria bacterium]